MDTLKIVAFGDSVVWGDGEKPDNKIVSLVGQRVADETGSEVRVVSFAHSGARLKCVDDQTSKVPTRGTGSDEETLGDLDGQHTTTSEQVACATEANSDAEIVLLDGCINK